MGFSSAGKSAVIVSAAEFLLKLCSEKTTYILFEGNQFASLNLPITKVNNCLMDRIVKRELLTTLN